jgi:hypothetical protein
MAAHFDTHTTTTAYAASAPAIALALPRSMRGVVPGVRAAALTQNRIDGEKPALVARCLC